MFGEEALVQAKVQLDKNLPEMRPGDESIIASLFDNEELLRGYHTRLRNQEVVIDSQMFIVAALPFSCPFFWSNDEAQVVDVDPNAVLAGKFYPHVTLDKQNGTLLADYLDSLADKNNEETAKYIRIAPFNLYAAHEGKNRVSLYRDLQRPIRALTRVVDYPSVRCLELTMLEPHGIPALAVKTSIGTISPYGHQFVRTPSGPVALLPIRESIDILERYGVSWGEPRYCPEAAQAERRWLLYLAHNYYEK